MSTPAQVLVCTAFDAGGTCTAQAWRDYGITGLGALSIADALAIATAMGVLWALAWGIKQMLRFLRES